MGIAVPSLSSWLNDIAEKADSLLAFYLVSEESQSYVYKGSVSSLPSDIAMTTGDISELPTLVKNTLGAMCSRYFDKSDITVNINEPDPTQPTRQLLTIDITVYENDVMYSLGRLIELVDGKTSTITDINNGG